MKEGWEYKRFNEVFDLQMGKTPDRKTPQYFEGDNVWVSIRDMGTKEITDSNEHISDEAIVASNIRKVKKGTVIMSFKLTVGKCAIAAKDLYTNEAIMAFNLKEGYNVRSDFLYYYLRAYKWTGANKAVMGMTLNKATISQHMIGIPPIPEQQQIVEELDLLSSIIEKKKEQLKELDNLAQSIFYKEYDNYTEQVHVSNYITSLGGGKSLAGSEECPNKVLKTGAVTYDYFKPDEVKFLPIDYIPKPEHLLKDGDVLISRMNTIEYVGACAYVWKAPLNTYLPDRLWRATLKDNINQVFLWLSLIQESSKKQIRALASGTSGSMKNISIPRFLSVKIKKVPLNKQNAIASKIEAIEHQKELIKQSIKEMETLFNSRMDYYFT